MLNRYVIDQVKTLLAQGELSQREIARRLKISRGTVNAIANGRRRDRPEPDPNEDIGLFVGPPRRCRDCGGMVYMPCLLCQVRRLKRLEEAHRPAPTARTRLSRTSRQQVQFRAASLRNSPGDRVA